MIDNAVVNHHKDAGESASDALAAGLSRRLLRDGLAERDYWSNREKERPP